VIPSDKRQQFLRKAGELRAAQLAAGGDDLLNSYEVIRALQWPAVDLMYFKEYPSLVEECAQVGLLTINYKLTFTETVAGWGQSYSFRLTPAGLALGLT
jgi:hypothetical protein